MGDTKPAPYGRGDGKAFIQRKGLEMWQNKWNKDRNGKRCYNIQKSVTIKHFKERKRKEEVNISRLKLTIQGCPAHCFSREKKL